MDAPFNQKSAHIMTMSSNSQCNSNNSPRLSSDSGIYVPLEIPFSELEETVEDKENSESLTITSQSKVQEKNNELAEKEDICQDANVVISLNPGLGLVGSALLVNPEVDSASTSDVPPPLPPKSCQRSKFEAPDDESKLLKLPSGVTGNNQSSHFVPGEELDKAVGKPLEKPPRRNKPKVSDTEEEKRRREWEAEEIKHKEKMVDGQERGPLEKIEKTESNEEITVTERHQDVGKRTALGEMLVIFTNEVQGGEGEKQREQEVGWLTHLLRTENVLAAEDSDFSSDEEHDEAYITGNSEPVSAKLQPKLPPLPLPPKITKKCPPKLPTKPHRLLYARGAELEEKQESTKQEDDEHQDKEERDEHAKGAILPDGRTVLPNHKNKASRGIKKIAKMIDRLKENREEKKRVRVGEMTMDREREQDIEVIWEEKRCKEERGLKGDDVVDQTSVTMTVRHVDLMQRRNKRRNASSDSLFGSFKVSSPVKLVADLLSGDEWSQFLDNDQKPPADPALHQSDSEDTAQPTMDVFNPEEHREVAAVSKEPIYEDIGPFEQSNIAAESQAYVRQQRVISAKPAILPEPETTPMSPRTRDILNSVEFSQHVQPNIIFSDIQSQGVLDSSVQKYRIKLSKKRKHRTPLHHQRRRNKKNETLSQAPYSTSLGQIFPTSVFYNVPASGGDEELQLPTVKSGGSSPRTLAKLKMALKDKTLLRATQPKEDRGK